MKRHVGFGEITLGVWWCLGTICMNMDIGSDPAS